MATRIVPVTLCCLWLIAALPVGGCSKEQPPAEPTTSTVEPYSPDAESSKVETPQPVAPKITVTPIDIDMTKARKDAEDLGMPKGSVVLSSKGNEIRVAVPMGSARDIKIPKVAAPRPKDVAGRAIIELWKNIQSVSATVSSKASQEGGVFEHAVGEGGTYDLLRRDGVILIRQYIFQTVYLDRGEGGKALTGQRIAQWYDGEYTYVVHELHKAKYWTKRRQPQAEVEYIGGRELIMQIGMNDEFDVEDSVRDGQPVYLFTGTKAGGKITTEYHIDKGTGLLVHKKIIDLINKTEQYLTYSDFKINPSFPADHFVFTPPEGVQYVDPDRANTLVGPAAPPAP